MARTDNELLWAFSKWGFDDRGWFPTTRKQYVYRVKVANDWLKQHRDKHIRTATTQDLKAYLATVTS